VIGSSLTLFAWRAPKVGLGGSFRLLSRETLLLGNNVLLTVAAGAVLLGTLYPLLLDALGLGKISVGPPYFEAVFVPLMAPAVLLMGLGPLARWKEARPADFWPRLAPAAGLAAVAAAVPLALGRWSPLAALGLLLATWAVAAGLTPLVAGAGNLAARLRSVPLARWGMVAGHVGVGLFILGVTLVKGYESTAEVRMAPGDSTTVGGYGFQFMGVAQERGPNYVAARARIQVSRDGQPLLVMAPEKRMYLVQRMPMTEAALDSGLVRDLYVSLGEAIDDSTWIVRIQHKPFVSWIWLGCLLMAAGGLLAAADRRYRIRRTGGALLQGAPLQFCPLSVQEIPVENAGGVQPFQFRQLLPEDPEADLGAVRAGRGGAAVKQRRQEQGQDGREQRTAGDQEGRHRWTPVSIGQAAAGARAPPVRRMR
jgi:cytochrome c-type biogenesis protein CcmF